MADVVLKYVDPTTGVEQTAVISSGRLNVKLDSAAITTFSGSATGQTAATLATLTTQDAKDGFAFSVYTLTGTTPAIKVYPSFDGTNFETTPLALVNLKSGATIDGDTGITAVGNYAIAGRNRYKSLRIDYTASVAGNAAIRGVSWKE